MVKKDAGFPPILIKHKGYFVLSKLMQAIKKWLEDNHYEFHIPKHKHKASEEEFGIYGERKINDYVKFRLTVDMRIWEFKEVEVVQDGKSVKKNYGRVAINFIPSYTLDYENRFGGSKFMQEIQNFYHKYIIKRKIEDYWEDELFAQAGGLIHVIKTNLEYEAM